MSLVSSGSSGSTSSSGSEIVSNFVPLPQILKKLDHPVRDKAKKRYVEEEDEEDLEGESHQKSLFSFKRVDWTLGRSMS